MCVHRDIHASIIRDSFTIPVDQRRVIYRRRGGARDFFFFYDKRYSTPFDESRPQQDYVTYRRGTPYGIFVVIIVRRVELHASRRVRPDDGKRLRHFAIIAAPERTVGSVLRTERVLSKKAFYEPQTTRRVDCGH